MVSTVDVSDIGPVQNVSIPIPEHGGVVVLRGKNGCGKTRTLEAVESAVSGRGKLDVRDGALSGEVSGFGVTLRVGRSTRRTGELEVSTLEGKLSVADLVDPGFKSPDAADAKRIKSLIQLTNVKPSVELFYELLGGREAFDSVVSTGSTDAGDLVIMADRIKRDCEAAARKRESEADHADGRARGAREAAGAVDVEGESDSMILQKRLEVAIRRESQLKAMEDASIEAESATARARRQLDAANEKYEGPTLEEAIAEEEAAAEYAALKASDVTEAERKVERAKAALADAERFLERSKDALGKAESEKSAATAARESVDRHFETLRSWSNQIEATIPESPSKESVEAAAAAVKEAREAVERGALIRSAQSKLAEAKAHAEAALAHRKEAARLREAAKGTDEVLSSVVSQAGSPLRVEAGRLVLTTRRGDTYFGELSHGERWRIALDVAIQAVGPGGVIVLQQEAWEGLDPMARTAIVEQVKGTEVVILTAECSADESVSAEVMS